MKLSQIKPNPSNPRIIRDDKFNKLVKSIQQFPAMMEKRPIVVDETMTVLGGNMRLRALQHIYGKSGDIPDNWVTVAEGWTEEQKREFVIKDNAAFGEWNWDTLANEWNPDDLTEWGIDIPVPEDATEIQTGEVKEDGFDPEQPVETVCQRGDLWQLGDHRLMCGDSTDAGDVEFLMDGKRARMVVTSPPYGVGKDYEQAGIEPWRKTIKGVIDAIKGKALIICWNIGDLFKTGTQFTEPTGAYSIAMWEEAGYGMLYNRIWKKPGANFSGNNPYYTVTTKPVQDYEYLFAFAERDADKYVQPIKDYLFGEAKKANITNDIIKKEGGPAYMFGHWFTNHQWSFIDEKNYSLIQSYCKKNDIDAFKMDYNLLKDDYLRNTIFSHSLPSNEFSEWGMYGVWEFNTVHERLGGHAAAFPIELPTRYIKLHSYEGDIILEPFGGTGTTLIAAEQLNRKCYMMELDPHYCDVIIARWEMFTGRKAEKITEGMDV